MPEINFPDPSGSPFTDPTGKIWDHDGDGWRVQGITSVAASDNNLFVNADFSAPPVGSWFAGDWSTNLLPVDGRPVGMGWPGWYAALDTPDSFFTQMHSFGYLDSGPEYVVSWEGDGDGSVTGLNTSNEPTEFANGPSPLVFSGTKTTMRFKFPLTAYNLKLEKGSVPTPFVPRGKIVEAVLSNAIFKPLELFETYNASGAGDTFANRITYDLMLGSTSTTTAAFGTTWPSITSSVLTLTNCTFNKIRVTNYGINYELVAIAAGAVTVSGPLYIHSYYI